jgi:hypothetical protein
VPAGRATKLKFLDSDVQGIARRSVLDFFIGRSFVGTQ